MTKTMASDNSGQALQTLQALDDRIQEIEEKIRSFEPLLEEVEEPALDRESEVENTRGRIKEMKVEERRLELAATEKEERVKRLEERLKGVRNVREESAVSAELDMVKQSLAGEEQEALSLLDQIRKFEDRLAEQEEALREAREEVEPRREELLAAREEAQAEKKKLLEQRSSMVDDMQNRELKVYERIRGGKGRRAVSRLTADGACGNCFNVIPLQLQNEVRHGSEMIRCEACGVILFAEEPEAEEGGEESEE